MTIVLATQTSDNNWICHLCGKTFWKGDSISRMGQAKTHLEEGHFISGIISGALVKEIEVMPE